MNNWFQRVSLQQKPVLPVGIRTVSTTFREGAGVSTKKKTKTKRLNHDGTVYYDEKRDRWVAQLPAVRRWDGTIKRTSVTARTQPEVLEKKRLLEAKALSPDAVDPSKLRVKEWTELYFKEFKNAELSPTTLRDYNSVVDNHVIPAIGSIQLQKVTPLHIQMILNAARRDGLSSGRIIKIGNVMRSLFAQAKRIKLIEFNPASAESCTLPRHEPIYQERAPLPEEVIGIWGEVKTNPVALAVWLSLACGFRRGELLGLRWGDVNFEARKIQVRQTVVEGNEGRCIKGPKSKAGARTVEVPAIAVDALMQLNAKQAKAKNSRSNRESQPVFQTQDGKTLSPSNFSRSYRALRDKLGFTDLRLKSFRHGHATILDEIDAPLKVRQERMGHAEVNTTMKDYTHTQNPQHRLVAENVNTVLSGLVSKDKKLPESTEKKTG